jgi:hypothetical protein
MIHGRVDIIDIKRDVMAAPIAILGHFLALVGRGIFEELYIDAAAASEGLDSLNLGTWMHVQQIRHKRAFIVLIGPVQIKRFKTKNIGKKIIGLIEIRHGYAYMIRTP